VIEKSIKSALGGDLFWITKLPLSLVVGCAAIYLVSFANLISLFDQDADTTTTLDVQSLLKLLFIACLGAYSLHRMLFQPGMLKLMFSIPGLLLTGVSGWLMVTSLLSASPAVSLASALASGACIWGAMGGALQIGPERVVRICGLACVAFLAGSWVLWLLNREAATFLEPIDNGEFVARFGGLSHPNAVGQYAGLALLIGNCLFLPVAKKPGERWLVGAMALLAVVSLVACASRTSILATAISFAFMYRHCILRGPVLALTLGIGTVLLGSFVVLSTQPGLGQKLNQRLINLVSKSGTTEELTSGTGRSEIWGASVRLIARRPLTGYGAATSKDLLADYTRYTHNMLLNVGLSGGIVPMALLAAAFVYGFGRLWSDPLPVADAIFLFLFLNGLAENVCFLVLDSAPMILLTTALVWRRVDAVHQSQLSAALSEKGGGR
jgi:hypothetical protein